MSYTKLPLELERLEPETRTWIIAKSAAEGICAAEVIRETLDIAATEAGFVRDAAAAGEVADEGEPISEEVLP